MAPDDDGDATYIENGTVGHKDLYGYQDLTGTPAAILAVQLATVSRKDDAGSRSLREGLNSRATTAAWATRVLRTSFALDDDRFEVEPTTGTGWAKTDDHAGLDGWSGRAPSALSTSCATLNASSPAGMPQ